MKLKYYIDSDGILQLDTSFQFPVFLELEEIIKWVNAQTDIEELKKLRMSIYAQIRRLESNDMEDDDFRSRA